MCVQLCFQAAILEIYFLKYHNVLCLTLFDFCVLRRVCERNNVKFFACFEGHKGIN